MSITAQPAPALPPMAPWDYLRLRREAAGLTIAQAGRAFWANPAHREDVERNLRGFEHPGVVMKPWVAETINRAFPFDPAVYRQLAEDPAHQHPDLCRSCAWDQWTEAFDLTGDSVTWAEGRTDLCTGCEKKAARKPEAAQGTFMLDRAA